MNRVSISHAEDKLVLELSVKEAMALVSGVNFWGQKELAAGARKKVRDSLERHLIPGSHRLYYESIH